MRVAQTTALAGLVTDPALDGPLPVLLLGDLDAAPGTPELAPLTEVLVDAWVAGGGDPAAVTLSSRVPFAPVEADKQIGRRIDHLLARPGTSGSPLVVSCAFLAGHAPVDGLHPSDHSAVVVDLAP